LAQPEAFEVVSFEDESEAPTGFAKPLLAW
jgi:hypothetical protein